MQNKQNLLKMQRDKFLTAVTKDKIAINYDGERIITLYVLEQRFEPIKQVYENIKKANKIIADFMNYDSVFIDAQMRLKEIMTDA